MSVMNAHFVPEAALARQDSMTAAEIARALVVQRHDIVDEGDASLQEGIHVCAQRSCCPPEVAK